MGGTIEGNPEVKISDFAKIEEGRPGCISFLANMKYAHYLYETKSSVVLVNKDFQLEGKTEATLIRVDNAYETVAKLLTLAESMKPRKKGIDSLAFIDPTATVGKDCYIGPFVAIGPGAVIGDEVVLHPHVTIGEKATVGNHTEIYSNAVVYHDCHVGNNCILHAGCVIGADGFGFAPTAEGYEKIPQIGIVTIEDNVEIGANTCIDRSTMGSTRVGRGVKVDNLVQIAHNVEIDENTVMSAQVGLAGSTKVGKWCMLGGQVGVAGHCYLADRVQVGAQSGIINSIKKEGAIMGYPAIDYNNFWRSSVVFKKLPEVYKQINQMQRELDELRAACGLAKDEG